ncbi:MAG: YfhO family protein, partial [Ruminococcus sp.]
QDRSEALLKAMVLSMEDMEKYSDITGYTKEKYRPLKYDLKNGKTHTFESITDSYEYGSHAYFSDCKALKSNSCHSFSYNSQGFEATINNKGSDNLLFFSVPYGEGWSATVNGEEVEIVNANIGFMAVKVPANQESKIIFKYTIPGFYSGIIISVVCAIIFFMYIFTIFIYNKRKGKHKR